MGVLGLLSIVGDDILSLSPSLLSMNPLLLELRSAGEPARPPLEGRGRGLTLTLPLLLLVIELLRVDGGGKSNMLSCCTVLGEGAGGRIGLVGSVGVESYDPLFMTARLGAD